MNFGRLLQSGFSLVRQGAPGRWIAFAALLFLNFSMLQAADFCPIQPNISSTPASCFQGDDGSAGVSPTGGIAPYTISWSNGASGLTLSNLTSGNYQFTITDSEGCTTNSNIFVAQPTSIQANVTRVNNVCRFDANGSLSLAATGGSGSYTYAWSNGATTATISGLTAGPYSYTITDSNGCTRSGGVSVLANTPVVATGSSQMASCFDGADGSATLNASGGVGPYTYAWSNGATGATATGLSAGTYQYTITDSEGCTVSGNLGVQSPGPVWSTFDFQYGCNGEDTGSAEIFANGGTPPYTYQWSNGATTAAIDNLAPGMYFYTVTDANGCTDNGLVCIFYSFFDASVSASAPDCSNEDDGSASLIVTNALPPVVYQWSNGATTSTINNLAPGDYGYTVSDASNCEVTGSVTIAAGTDVVASVLELQGGNLQAMGTGGTPPYTYQWSNGETTQIADEYTSGTYSVTVTDVNGCFGIISGLVPTDETCPDNISYPGMIGVDQTLCAPGNTPITIVETDAPSGGSFPVEYLWMSNTVGGPFNPNFWTPIPNTNSSSYSPGPLNQTTYFIRCVRSAEDGCVYLESNTVVITVENNIDPVINRPPLGCFGQTQTYSVTNIASNADVEWTFNGPVTVNTTSGDEVEVTFVGGGYLNFSVTITEDGCSGTFSQQVTINGNCFDGNDDNFSGSTGAPTVARVYPNPALDVATLNLDSELNETAQVTIFSSTQQLMDTYTLPAGTRRLDLDVANYPAGLYLVQLRKAGEAPVSMKLLKN